MIPFIWQNFKCISCAEPWVGKTNPGLWCTAGNGSYLTVFSGILALFHLKVFQCLQEIISRNKKKKKNSGRNCDLVQKSYTVKKRDGLSLASLQVWINMIVKYTWYIAMSYVYLYNIAQGHGLPSCPYIFRDIS